MATLTTVIVDDEPLARVNVRKALEAATDWRVIGEFGNAAEARLGIRRLNPDVAFLDIKMPEQSGMELAAALQQEQTAPLIVFVTAFDDYAVQAFELFAFDYLLKPFDDERLGATIARIEQCLSQAEHREAIRRNQAVYRQPNRYLEQLVIRSVGSIRIVKIANVRCFRASGNYVEVSHSEGTHLQRVQLGYLEKHLDPLVFCRIHRSTVVRLDEIREIQSGTDDNGMVVLADGTELSFSSRYKTQLYHQLGL